MSAILNPGTPSSAIIVHIGPAAQTKPASLPRVPTTQRRFFHEREEEPAPRGESRTERPAAGTGRWWCASSDPDRTLPLPLVRKESNPLPLSRLRLQTLKPNPPHYAHSANFSADILQKSKTKRKKDLHFCKSLRGAYRIRTGDLYNANRPGRIYQFRFHRTQNFSYIICAQKQKT